MEYVLDFALLGMLVMTAVAIARLKNLFAAVMLSGIYGLLSASFFVTMDAVDVAFTEASVGAGISPLLMLTALTMTGSQDSAPRRKPWLTLALVVSTGGLLVFGTLGMPEFGSPDAPIHQHVVPRYIGQSYEEIGIPNIVTSILASYRGYDTMGEVAVIFTAGMAVLALLMVPMSQAMSVEAQQANMHEQKILRIVSKILIPAIFIFALYVQFHGDYGPGGGFQAGVIFAAAIILYTMLFGLSAATQVVQQGVVRFCAALGLLIYGSVGLVSFLSGKNYLDYSALAHEAAHGQHYGILLVELGVGITVASVMISIYFSFAGRVAHRGRAAA